MSSFRLSADCGICRYTRAHDRAGAEAEAIQSANATGFSTRLLDDSLRVLGTAVPAWSGSPGKFVAVQP